jgi:hypothetical protein
VPNILTADEAARIAATDPTDEKLLDMLSQVDATIRMATGRDWTIDRPVHPIAKRAASCRLAVDFDVETMNSQQIATLERSYLSAITQLEAAALEMEDI